MNIFKQIFRSVEHRWFGTLTRMGSSIGVSVSKLRIFFIYSAFATAGIFFIFYLMLSFFYYVKDIFITRRPSVFDL